MHIEISGRKSERFYGCCKEPYLDITSAVVMGRSTLYYSLNLLIPCVPISTLASLVFLVPSASGEKISLAEYFCHHHGHRWAFSHSNNAWRQDAKMGITVPLSLTVFMLLMAEIMPATSDSVPLIDLCGPAELVCLVPAYEAPREARVHPARHNKTTCSSPFSVDLNASSSSSHLATSNPLYIGFRGLETMPLSTTTTPPDSGMGCERGAGQVGKRSLLGSLEQDLGKDPERGGTTSASASETKTRRRC
ncbi:unnamed protein product [Gadus morhua 'NCC']